MKTLKIHSLETGWRDRDYVMLHACFQILVDFVEKEWKEDKDHCSQGNYHNIRHLKKEMKKDGYDDEKNERHVQKHSF